MLTSTNRVARRLFLRWHSLVWAVAATAAIACATPDAVLSPIGPSAAPSLLAAGDVAPGGPIGDSTSGTAIARQTTAGDTLMLLDPNTIESIEILKGAAAAALYGASRCPGIIIVTTRKRAPYPLGHVVPLRAGRLGDDRPGMASRAAQTLHAALGAGMWGE